MGVYEFYYCGTNYYCYYTICKCMTVEQTVYIYIQKDRGGCWPVVTDEKEKGQINSKKLNLEYCACK